MEILPPSTLNMEVLPPSTKYNFQKQTSSSMQSHEYSPAACTLHQEITMIKQNRNCICTY
eukprot:6101483-Karenia_brevis.AAC.1